jgi:hypothetical protein
VFVEEVTVIGAVGSAGKRGGVKKGLAVVDLDKVPTRAKGASRPVRDEKKAISGLANHSMEGGSSGRGRRELRSNDATDGNSGGSGNGGNGKRGW